VTPTKIRDARLRLGLSKPQAAALCGVPFRTYEKWDNGERRPPPYVLQRVLETLKSPAE
jgi:DNA-binding transcriptional regulator YiaG